MTIMTTIYRIAVTKSLKEAIDQRSDWVTLLAIESPFCRRLWLSYKGTDAVKAKSFMVMVINGNIGDAYQNHHQMAGWVEIFPIKFATIT